MADINRSIEIQWQSNTNQINNELNELDSTLKRLLESQSKLTEGSDNWKRVQTRIDEVNAKYAESKTRLDALRSSQDGFTKSSTSLGSAILNNGGAMGLLSMATGGLAMDFKDAVEASDLLSGGMGRALKSFKSFSTGAKAALISTGFGALLVLVGTLVTYWEDIKGLVNGVSSALAKQNELASKNAAFEQDKLSALESQENTLKLQGKSESEILAIKIKQKNETIKALEFQIKSQEEIKKAQIEASRRNKDILAGALKFISLPISALLKSIDLVGKAFGKDFNLMGSFDTLANLVFDPEQVAAEGDKTIAETKKKLNELKNSRDGDILSQKETQKQADADRLAKQEQAYDKELNALTVKNNKEKAEAIKHNGNLLTVEEKFLRDQIALQKKYGKDTSKLETELAQNGKDSLDNFKNIIEKTNAKIIESNKEKAETDKQIQLYTLDNIASSAKEEEQSKLDSDKRIRDNEFKDEEERKQRREANMAAIYSISESGLSAIESLETLGLNKSKAGQAASKALALTQIGIDSAVAFSKMMQGTEASAAGAASVAGPAAPKVYLATKIAFYASGTAQILANIAKAKQLLSGGGGGASSGGGQASAGGMAKAQPNVNFVSSTENQIANTINRNQQEQPPIKAYVVSSEVSTAQALDRNLVESTTI